ncbi:MAG: ureAB [Microbacteriaceae bacterium]|nr:ureAB [Microbacteriaceae bacterium]
MNLSPTEIERLVIFNAAEFARRNKRLGIRLSHPEAVAYLTDEAMLMARQDVPYAEIRDRVSRLLGAEDVMAGVPGMITLVMMELPMEEGTKLLAVFDPIVAGDASDILPGEVVPGSGPIDLFPEVETVTIEVVNTGDRDIQVRSQTHFFEVNRALAFDREAAYGTKLAVSSGAGERFEPGLPKRVRLVPIAGDRIVLGQGGLVNGQLDDPDVRSRAFAMARERGYLAESDGS